MYNSYLLSLNSDFEDYYDSAFDVGSSVEFNRVRTLSKEMAYKLLRKACIPAAKNIPGRLAGAGNYLVKIGESQRVIMDGWAVRELYSNSEVVKVPGESCDLMTNIYLGNTIYRMGIQHGEFDGSIEKITRKKYFFDIGIPIFKIDYMTGNGGCLALGLDEYPIIANTPAEYELKPETVVEEIKKAMLAYSMFNQ